MKIMMLIIIIKIQRIQKIILITIAILETMMKDEANQRTQARRDL